MNVKSRFEEINIVSILRKQGRSSVVSISLLLFGLVFQSCQSKKLEGFENYIVKDLGGVIQRENDLYVIWDIKSCGFCLNKTKEVLSEVAAGEEKNIHVIIASSSRKDVNIFLGYNLVKDLNVIYDLKNKLLDTEFYEYNNFYVFEFQEGNLVDQFHYNIKENLNRFERSIKRFKNFE